MLHSIKESPARGVPSWMIWLVSSYGWLLFLTVYFIGHFFLRISYSSSFQIDGAEQVVLAQTMKWNYGNFQPPLFTWIVNGLWRMFPISVESFVLLRYLILFGVFWLWRLVAIELFKNPARQLLATVSWLLVYDFTWKLHQGSTHTTLMMLALLMSFYAMLMILKNRDIKWYALLGLSIGLGVSSKYSFVGFVLSALIAGLLVKEVREAILTSKIILTIPLALFFSIPALESIVLDAESFFHGLNGQLGHSAYKNDFVINEAFISLFNAIAEYCGLTIILLLIAGGVFNIKRDEKDWLLTWMAYLFFVGVIILLSMIFLFDAQSFKARWLHPFLWFFPFLVLRLMVDTSKPRQGIVVLTSALTLLLLVYALRIIQLSGFEYLDRKPSKLSWPIVQAIEKINFNDFRGADLSTRNMYLAAHVILVTKGAVKINVSSEPGGIELFGDVFYGPSETGINKNSVESQRGNVGYRIGWRRL